MIENRDNMADIDELKARIEALEEGVETVCRPLADLLPPKRVHTIELAGYEAQLKIAALEKRISDLESKAMIIAGRAEEAVRASNAIQNSRIWQALIKGSSVLLRFTGHHPGK